MNTQKREGGKRKLVKDVMARGFPARKAARAVTAAIELMKEALACHEPVEMPGVGTLTVVVQKGRPKQRLQTTRNIATKQIERHVVTFSGRRRVIKLRPDPNLKLPVTLPPAAPSKPKAQLEPIQTVNRIPTVAHTYRSGVQPLCPRRSVRRPGY